MKLEEHVGILFNSVRSIAGTIPPPGSLKKVLVPLIPHGGTGSVPLRPNVARLFASASVEMWLRAVHSFMISTSLTNSSKLWASVNGYYASHYAVRAFAHLLGYFHIRQRGTFAQLHLGASGSSCEFAESKGPNRKEHSCYWRRVKEHYSFVADGLFTENPEDRDESDLAHRTFANYIDHLNNFQNFTPLSSTELRQRIDFISKLELTAYPIPNRTKYPDVDAVQIVAYHRILQYRELLNDILNDSNRFWNVHRDPSWCQGLLAFQRVRPNPIAAAKVP